VGEHGAVGAIAEHIEIPVDETTIRTRDVGEGLYRADRPDMCGGALDECLYLLGRVGRRRPAGGGREGGAKQAGKRRARANEA
jgi:hypothetical protein